ncbi:hypothetical protein [Glaciihabitans sp. dw_435]|uniref:hypothetical protein n=1 Tax=Glaciihabitans sp. dw_435 TaxID=2720081 RepID=UPI001BD5F995|nr:hypothetical protein [Glaciihabitans sp. dw_435]
MTNPIARVWAASIWAKGAIPPDEWKYRSLKRVVLPLYDVLIIIGGILGARFGVPAVEEFYPSSMIDTVSQLFALAGLLALLGIAFPSLWLPEVIAKAAIIGLLSSYVGALISLTANGDPTRGFVSTIAIGFCLLPAWRLGMLGAERRTRRAEHVARRAALDERAGD